MINENYPNSTWRLIKSRPADGAWNMAIDEAILAAIGNELVPPTLRFYAWSPPCLSLGYAQPFTDVDPPRIREFGWDVVRRVTGGRAILHTDELTYSVCAPHDEPRLAGSVLESYRRLSKALLNGLTALDLPVEALPQDKRTQKKQEPVCFEIPSNYEITVHGKKLVGSAQARKKSGILQHGTLPLHGDLTRITQALKFQDERQRQNAGIRLLDRATTVESVFGKKITWDEAVLEFSAAFAQTLNIHFEEGPLTPWETDRAASLVKEKYAHPSWTERI